MQLPEHKRDEHEFGPRDFRNTLGRFATGITVVTMRGLDDGLDDGATDPWQQRREVTAPSVLGERDLGPVPGRPRTYGITVNSFMSVSLEPPLVAVSIDKRARAHATLAGSERFGVSVLAAGQEQLSDHFAGRPVNLPAEPYEEFASFPVLRGALAQLVCRSHQALDVGDHTIYVGQVEALRAADGEPLVFFRGAYHALPELTLAR